MEFKKMFSPRRDEEDEEKLGNPSRSSFLRGFIFLESYRRGKAKMRLVAGFLCLCFFFTLCGCSTPAKKSPASILDSCAPRDEADSKLNLSVVSAASEPDGTMVRVIAEARGEETFFDLPVYRLSAGRWLLGENGRAYLLDAACREYRLKDRRSALGEKVPLDGRIRLKPGERFEAILVFPKMIDPGSIGKDQRAVLVYGNRVLPFTFSAQP